jgi:hypothetical protein
MYGNAYYYYYLIIFVITTIVKSLEQLDTHVISI